jgi:hypothetical protein
MRKIIMTLILTIVLSVGSASVCAEEIAKEGSSSGKTTWTTHYTLLPMGKARVQINYEGYGVSQSATGEGLLHNASGHVLGGLIAVKGVYKNDSGLICFTRPDGDKIFMTYKCAGQAGKSGKGTLTYVGGTGKFIGIQGSGEFTRYMLRPPAKGAGASFSVSKSNWKIVEPKK